MDEIEMLHSLASDLQTAGITAEEAAAGLGVVLAFEELGIARTIRVLLRLPP